MLTTSTKLPAAVLDARISTRNITRLFRSASPERLARGLAWYGDAREVATALAVKNDVSVATASGVIAALSPLNSWGANVNLAARLLASGGLTEGYLKVGLAKANAILAGSDPLDVLRSDKVRNFYLCIESGGDTGAVCVDRHAYSLAVDVRFEGETMPSLSAGRYAAVSAAYGRAAARLDVSAARVQAVTWLEWRARFWADGAFDRHTAV